jgi:hypothetical protein
LKGKKVFEWLLDQYHVYICSKVKYECFATIQSNRDDYEDPDNLKSGISKLLWNADFEECLKYLDCYCAEKRLSKFLKIHDGERQSFALALHLSLKLRKPVILLTDDFDALEAYVEILGEQKFGIAKSLPDFIINVFQMTENLDENVTRGALQSYYHLIRRVDLCKKFFDERMKLSCRTFWLDNCYAKCFS